MGLVIKDPQQHRKGQRCSQQPSDLLLSSTSQLTLNAGDHMDQFLRWLWKTGGETPAVQEGSALRSNADPTCLHK
uniref:Uncharacterized protein n=1 Tax=uncultured prokaryote TaxID=198431 RepID=A0A0H5QJG7_9ZZZZ|nr:hypothetical protein [uncultured prokaryote]